LQEEEEKAGDAVQLHTAYNNWILLINELAY
jgi:hypothetical protein